MILTTAGDLKGLVALLSLGIKDLSMVESSILAAKSLVRNLNYKELEEIRERILTEETPEGVKELLKNYINY